MGEGEEMARGPWLCSRRATTKDPGGRRLCFLKRKPISLLGGGGCGSFCFKRENGGCIRVGASRVRLFRVFCVAL